MLPPLVFEPILKRIRWGGRRLGTLLRKSVGDASDYAESWEIADHADGQSHVASGPFAGHSLAWLIQIHRQALLGRHSDLNQFPLLIKFLDANDWLSLQVHPDDELAKNYNASENGKTEAWVILESRPDSQICAGLKSGVTSEDLRHALTAGSVEDCLNLIHVSAGDCIFVPAGTVHALGPGIVLAEVQQQSNLTFRLFDWGRVDASGNPRPIHVDESIACTDFSRGPVSAVSPLLLSDQTHEFEELVRCEHFVMRRHRCSEPVRIQADDVFRILISLQGDAIVKTKYGSVQITLGSTVLLPACSEEISVTPVSSVTPISPVTLLEVFCP